MRTCPTSLFLAATILVFGTITSRAAWQPVGSEFRINTTITGNGSYPAVTYGDGGMAIVVWTNYFDAGTNNPIYMQRYAADGTPIGAEIQVNTGLHPDVAAYPGVSFFVVVWEQVIDGGRRTVAARFDNATGNRLGALIFPDGSGAHESDPAVIMDSTGNFVLTWKNTGSSDIIMRRYNASGTALGSTVQINTYQNPVNTPAITYLSDGRFAVAWQMVLSFGTSDTRARLCAADGTLLGSSEICVCGPAEVHYGERVAPLPGGGYIITYSGTDIQNQVGVYVQSFDSSSNRILPETKISTADALKNDGADILANPDGTFTMAWLAHAPGSTFGDGVRRDFSAAGLPLSAEMPANTTPLGCRSEIVVADNSAHSRMLMVWDGQGSGDADGIYGQFFEAANPVPTLFSQLKAAAVSGGVELRWSVSTDASLRGFAISRRLVGADRPVVMTPELLAPSTRRFVDSQTISAGEYEYQVMATEQDGSQYSSPPVRIRVEGPSLALFANEPNPFNPSTRIRFEIPDSAPVQLDVFDVAGRHVARLADGMRPAGRHEVHWNGTDKNGTSVSSGVYVYRLTAGNRSVSRKMVLLK